MGISFFMGGLWGPFFKVILMSLVEVQNVFLIINCHVWDRFRHVRTIFDTVGLWKSIFHWHICENFVSKSAHLSVGKAFISNAFIKTLQTLKSAHFDTKSSQICQWRIAFHNPTVSKMVRTCPNQSQKSKLIIRNTFWTLISDIRITLKKWFKTLPKKRKRLSKRFWTLNDRNFCGHTFVRLFKNQNLFEHLFSKSSQKKVFSEKMGFFEA